MLCKLKYSYVRILIEVIGLIFGKFVDEYIIRVIDVLVMLQLDIGIRVGVVDLVFEIKLLEMLKEMGILICLLVGMQLLRFWLLLFCF